MRRDVREGALAFTGYTPVGLVVSSVGLSGTYTRVVLAPSSVGLIGTGRLAARPMPDGWLPSGQGVCGY